MAVTGAILVLYLVVHMLGNLKIFLGRAEFDHYAHWLRTIGEPAIPYRTLPDDHRGGADRRRGPPPVVRGLLSPGGRGGRRPVRYAAPPEGT